MSSREADLQLAHKCQPTKVVVIGFGNPIRGDDAFGPLVADKLLEELQTPQIEILSRHILTAEMAEHLRDASLVLFVDAAVDGPLGEIVQRTLTPKRDDGQTIAHGVDPRGLLAWTEALYGHAPAALLLSTRAATLDYSHYQLSPTVQAAVEPLICRIRQLAEDHLGDRYDA